MYQGLQPALPLDHGWPEHRKGFHVAETCTFLKLLEFGYNNRICILELKMSSDNYSLVNTTV